MHLFKIKLVIVKGRVQSVVLKACINEKQLHGAHFKFVSQNMTSKSLLHLAKVRFRSLHV